MDCIKLRWIAHCQGYADTHTGDAWTLMAIANLYNCNVTVHTSTYSHTTQPTNSTHNAHTLILDLYIVDSKIESEQWSHYCSTHPLETRWLSGRKECLTAWSNPFALVNPIAAPNLACVSGTCQQGSSSTTPAADGTRGVAGTKWQALEYRGASELLHETYQTIPLHQHLC